MTQEREYPLPATLDSALYAAHTAVLLILGTGRPPIIAPDGRSRMYSAWKPTTMRAPLPHELELSSTDPIDIGIFLRDGLTGCEAAWNRELQYEG